MTENATEENEQSPMSQGPGELLQAARIELGITVDDIARQMNLNVKILTSIEDDDYNDIQSPIFTRGYLRTYARLVDLDENEIIGLFGQFYQKGDPDIKSISNTTPEISSNDLHVKWMTYFVIAALIALLSVWWINNYQIQSFVGNEAKNSNNNLNEEVAISAVTSLEKPAVALKDINLTENMADQQDEAIVELQVNDLNEQPVESVVEEEKQDEPQDDSLNPLEINLEEVLTTEPDSVENITSTSAEAEVEIVEEASIVEEVISEPVKDDDTTVYKKVVSSPEGSDVMILNIIATSWGEIHDSTKFRLIQDLLNGGEKFKMVGKKPFKLFLGNGYGVEITLNGETVDFSKHIKSNNTARFEVGK